MVVKGKRGRRRYVLFDVGNGFTKESLIRELRKNCPENTPYVIQVAENFAIIRCEPKLRDETVDIVARAVPGSHSIVTSGTLASIRDRFPMLKISRAQA